MSLRASFRLIVKSVVLMLIWITCYTALAQVNLNQQTLHQFMDRTLHGPVDVIAQKQSNETRDGAATYVAVVCRGHHDENILIVIRIDGNKFHLVWSSAKLKKSLGVITPDSLQLRMSNGTQYLTLLGCNPHDCGGINGSYTAEVFEVSSGHMNLFDIWSCAQKNETPDHTKPQICVAGDYRSASVASPSIKGVVTDLIHEKIAGANRIFVQFESR